MRLGSSLSSLGYMSRQHLNAKASSQANLSRSEERAPGGAVYTYEQLWCAQVSIEATPALGSNPVLRVASASQARSALLARAL